MELWIPITLFAAFGQNVRSALQKHLTSTLSTVGATQARFLFAVPFAILYVSVLGYATGQELPRLNAGFVAYATAGGLAQVLATALLVALFSHRNFFVGTALSKTETIQTAILGLVLLGDDLPGGAIIGICIGIAGVIAISAAKSHPSLAGVLTSLRSKASIIGLSIGLFFGIAAVCFRGASLSLSGGFVIQAAVTLENAGYVRAVGQVELVFAYLASTLFFRERTTPAEFLGIALIVAGILVLLRYG